MNEIQPAVEAPDFTLPDQDQNPVTMSSFRGEKNVMLAFYPLDWSPVCTNENVCFTQDLSRFETVGAKVLAISVDSTYSHKAWAEKLGLKHTLLSDMKREVCKKYGLYLEEENIAKRATVIVDKQGLVRYVKVQEITTPRDDREILEVLTKLK